MAISLLILCAVVLTVSSIPIQVCPGSYPVTVISVDVPGCSDTEPPCVLKKGTNATVTITFKTPANGVYTVMTNAVFGEISHIDVPFPGYPEKQKDMCKLGVGCPTKGDTSYTEKVTLPIASIDPSIAIVGKWELEGDGKIVACVLVLLKIES